MVRGTVFQEIRPRDDFKTGDFVEEKLGRLAQNDSGSKKQLRRILHEPVGGTPRHACRVFRAKNRRSDLPMFSMKHII